MEQPRKITDVLSREERQGLTEKSNLAGMLVLLGNWAAVAACFALLALWPNVFNFVLVVALLGGRQIGFAFLTHEASHRTLFRSRWMNDVLCDWLCARPIWTDVARYREHHIRHHNHTGTDADPDMSLVRPFPCTPSALRRKLLRDISGISGIRRIVGLIGMDIGMLEYTVAADPKRIPRNGRPLYSYLRQGVKNMAPVLLTNVLLFAVLAAFDVAWTYSAWVLAYLTSFSLYLRIRSIAEHACSANSDNPFENTRTTKAGWLAQLTIAPFNINYHLEHHLMAAVPFFRLPELHRRLLAHDAVRPVASYREVLRLASSL